MLSRDLQVFGGDCGGFLSGNFVVVGVGLHGSTIREGLRSRKIEAKYALPGPFLAPDSNGKREHINTHLILTLGNAAGPGYMFAMQPDKPIGVALRDRTLEIDRKIEAHLSCIKELESERGELAATLKTLTKYGLVSELKAPVNSVGGLGAGPKKTVPEMILEILSRDFPDGAKPEAVLSRVHERYDPNADPNNVRPTLWRMAKDGRLEKSGELYRLPQTNEAAGSPHEDAPTASAQEHSQEGVFG